MLLVVAHGEGVHLLGSAQILADLMLRPVWLEPIVLDFSHQQSVLEVFLDPEYLLGPGGSSVLRPALAAAAARADAAAILLAVVESAEHDGNLRRS